MQELKIVLCQEIKYCGLFDMKGLLPYNIRREWSLQRNNIRYDIVITTAVNQKSIIIKASKLVKFSKVYELLSEILKYECLYDGRFFVMNKLEVDGIDKSVDIKPYMLSYYSGTRSYFILSQPMNDNTLGKAEHKIEQEKEFDNCVIEFLFDFVKEYNRSKHEINQDENKDRMFNAEDAVVSYFVARILGVIILQKLNINESFKIYEIYK